MNNKIKEFKNDLLAIYNKYEIVYNYFDNENYLKFLYAHMNEVEVIISSDNIKGDFILSNKISINEKFSNNISLIYRKYLTDIEKNIIKSGTFYIFIAEKIFPKIQAGELEENLKKFYNLKNRRDFLIPTFFHKLTIDTFSTFEITNIENYKKNNSKFFKLLIYLRKYIRTIERLGTMIDSSITLNIHNIRKNNDLDLVILHPRHQDKTIRDNLVKIQNLEYVDPFFDGIIEWDGETKQVLDKLTNEITEGKVNDYFEIIFNPEYHFYFFGIKVVSFDYDLKYRALRRFPKNVADLLMTKEKLKIKVPKIKRLENVIHVEKNTYNPDKFLKVVSNYLKRFNHPSNDIEKRIEDLY